MVANLKHAHTHIHTHTEREIERERQTIEAYYILLNNVQSYSYTYLAFFKLDSLMDKLLR